MDLQLRDRVALVTGAGRGLGRAAVEALVAEGALVYAVARSSDELGHLAATAPDRIVVETCDLADRDQVLGLTGRVAERLGVIHVLVNNAGIAPASRFVDQDLDVWDRVLAVNVTAPAILCREAAKAMLAAGGGSMINVASTAGLRGKGRLAAYAASKAALIRLSEALSAEWAKHGIRVNAIAPGAFQTRAQQEVLDSDDLLRRRVERIPVGRMGQIDEIGALVCYLASPASSFVTGATFVIDGGEAGKL